MVSCSCAYVGSLFSLCRWSRFHHSEGAGSFSGVGQAIDREYGSKAASLSVAEQYIQAFSQLAKTNNTLLLPEKTGDISSMVAQVHHTCTVVKRSKAIYVQVFQTSPHPLPNSFSGNWLTPTRKNFPSGIYTMQLPGLEGVEHWKRTYNVRDIRTNVHLMCQKLVVHLCIVWIPTKSYHS